MGGRCVVAKSSYSCPNQVIYLSSVSWASGEGLDIYFEYVKRASRSAQVVATSRDITNRWKQTLDSLVPSLDLAGIGD